MSVNIELVKFLDAKYHPEHDHIPGYISILCHLREFGTRDIERGYDFQYDRDSGKVFFLVYPTGVQLPVGIATSVEDAIEQAKQFLTKWLNGDFQFQRITSQEIQRLEAEKRVPKELHNIQHMEENKRKLMDALRKHRKKSGKG
jgi:hypothetical protein